MNLNLLRNQWRPLPEEVVRRMQAERLREYLRTAVLPFSAHYGRIFQERGLTANSIGTLEDLQQLPFTTKKDLLNTTEHPRRFKDFVLIPDEKVLARRPSTILRAVARGPKAVKREFESEYRPIFMTFTTGRSAEPIPFLYTQHDLDRLALAGGRIVEICAARREDRMLNTLPFAPHLAFWLAHYAGTAGGLMTLSSGGGKVMGTEGNILQLRKLKPDILIGLPTFTYHLLHQAAEKGVKCENLRRIVLGGEKVSDGLRHKLRGLAEELGARDVEVLAIYGFTEAKLAWTECPFPHDGAPSGYHLHLDTGIIEIVEPETGKALPSGNPGEIVFTPLDARGSVILRYRTGDFIDGGLTYEPCPHCGRSLPRLLGNISRRCDVKEMHLDKIKGTLIDFNELEHLLDDIPQIGSWQVELRKVNDDPLELDELILHVQTLHNVDESLLSHELSERCYANLEVHPNRVQFHSAAEMRQLQGVGKLLKEDKLADHRPATRPGLTPAANTGSSEQFEDTNGKESKP